MNSDHMTLAALGRPFTLGMLYDARKDELIPGLTLWDEKTLQENTVKEHHGSSESQISASDTIESKSSLLDVEASLKASFLGGLIEVGGSAKYLNDTKKFKNQSRVTFEYKATTHFKQLMIDHLAIDTQQKEVIGKGSATHVVTGILYGANGFFVFDSEKLEASSVQEIQGSVEAVIKKIPAFDVEGRVDIKLNDEEQKLINKFSCKFYGDLLLDSNPATFVDAVKTYVQLPKLLKENPEKESVPLKIWLMPLTKLDLKAAELVSGISIGLVKKIQDTLEDLKEIGMRCNDSLFDGVVQNFPQIHKELSNFQNLCNYYTTKLQQTMAVKLPLIREGKEDESELEKVFDDRKKSPFSEEKLSEWLDHKEREINVIRSCVEMMKGKKIVPDKSELDREVLAAGVDHALCFVFPSLESADPCLNEMADYLNSSKSGCTNEDPWYYSDEVFIKMREKAEAFQSIAEELKNNSRFRFLVTAIANEKFTGATIYHYKNGILVSDDFSKPNIPPVEKITDRRDLIWYACDLNLDPNTVNGWLTLSEENKKASVETLQTYPDHPQRFDQKTQVLCKEGLTGRHYWEVEWSSGDPESIYICAAYKGVERKGDSSQVELGRNKLSWAFGKTTHGSNQFRAFHDGVVWENNSRCDWSRVGVYLDWPAGTLSFYRVSSNTLTHIYTFNNTFTEPLYPGLWVYNYFNSAHLLPFK